MNPILGIIVLARIIKWLMIRAERKRKQLFNRFMEKVWKSTDLKDVPPR